MIRPLTFLALLLAAGSGLYLYQTKHRAEMLDTKIERALKQAAAARERVGLLRAEWALLNEPDRLSRLASQYLQLQPLAPSQFVSLADLGSRLPAIPGPSSDPNPGTPAPDVVAQSGTAPAAVPSPDAPVRMVEAVAAPARPSPAHPVVTPPNRHPAPRPAPRPTAVASARPAPHPWRRVHPARRPVLAPVLSAFATPVSPMASRVARVTPIRAYAPATSSALGAYSHIALAPPIPMGGN